MQTVGAVILVAGPPGAGKSHYIRAHPDFRSDWLPESEWSP